MKQIYENYTIEDQTVWQILFDRQMEKLPDTATSEFYTGLEKIKFNREAIPVYSESNQILENITGWNIYEVPGIVDDDLFFKLLSEKKFPATTWIRKMSQLDYLEEPDMFHDVFAHVPLLTNQHFVDFLQELSKMAVERLDDPWAIELLSRVYWYTVEFGLIRENSQLRIYGAGILSSAGETEYSLSNKPEHYSFDVAEILDSGYRKDTFQSRYFIIDGYEQLYNSLDLIRTELEKRLRYVALTD